MALVLLPSFAVASIVASLPNSPLAQTGIPFDPAIQYLADKNMNYWFLALSAIAIASWSFIAKWLLQQLESQRIVNTELVNRLVGYMEKDHAQTVIAMNVSSGILAQVVEKLNLQSTTIQK